jgi:benzodiazapine receptor
MKPLTHLLPVLAVAAVAIIGSVVTAGTLQTGWYEALPRPSWQPPNSAFGPVWTALYIGIAIAGVRAFHRARRNPPAVVLWVAQLVLNLAWTLAFFGAQSVGGALVVIVALWVTILGFAGTEWRTDRVAALFFVPYLAWVTFAAALNAAIWAALQV